MTLPKEECQYNSHNPIPKDLPPGFDIQAAPSGITEKPASLQVTEARSDNPRPYNREGTLKIGNSHQVGQSNSVKDPTEVNLDASKQALSKR